MGAYGRLSSKNIYDVQGQKDQHQHKYSEGSHGTESWNKQPNSQPNFSDTRKHIDDWIQGKIGKKTGVHVWIHEVRNAAQNHEEAKEEGQYEFEGFHWVGFKGEWIQMYAHFCNDRNLIFAELNTHLFVLNSNCPHLRGKG